MNCQFCEKGQAVLSMLLLAIGVAFAGYFVGHSISSIKQYDRYVTVKGLAEKNVVADQAIWTLRYSYASDQLNDLYQGLAKAQNAVKTFLLQQGFQESDMQAQPVSVNDNESYGYSGQGKAKRYNANSSIVLTTPNISSVENAMQKTNQLVQTGIVLSSSTINYSFTQLNQIKPQMLTIATANAREAASAFAKDSHSELSGIRQATQGLFTIKNADDSFDNTDPNKIIRVVTTVQYYLLS